MKKDTKIINFKGKQKQLHKPKEPLKCHIMKTAFTESHSFSENEPLSRPLITWLCNVLMLSWVKIWYSESSHTKFFHTETFESKARLKYARSQISVSRLSSTPDVLLLLGDVVRAKSPSENEEVWTGRSVTNAKSHSS